VTLVQPAPGHYEQHAAWAPDASLLLTICLSPVPPHSPYQAGTWVRLHGFVGYKSNPNDPDSIGFRGVVLGGFGSTVLRGITDDGRDWAEHWGALRPDGPCDCRGPWCACCPHPQRFPSPVVGDVQLTLFDLIGVS
jgi:hypothetical protein